MIVSSHQCVPFINLVCSSRKKSVCIVINLLSYSVCMKAASANDFGCFDVSIKRPVVQVCNEEILFMPGGVD